jgi:predicted alpha/beta superfamily hydrolase
MSSLERDASGNPIRCGPTGAEPGDSTGFVLGKNLTLRSRVLGEDRPLQIFTPSDYESALSSYPTLPVLYLLDGADNFMHVTGVVDYLARKNRIPPMIIVAVGNTDRPRDLTPTHTLLGLNGRRWDTFESTGGADKFFEFLRDELMPYVEKNYRAAPFRILDGHSFGGLFAIKILLENPDAFQAYLAVSPSLWWDNQVMLKRSGPIGRAGQCLFLSVANEGGLHQKSIEAFADQLRERAVPGFRWDFQAYPGETHNSVPHLNLYDALKFVFADWDFMALAYDEVRVSFEDGVKHCQALSERFGFTIVLPESRAERAACAAFPSAWMVVGLSRSWRMPAASRRSGVSERL